MNKQRENEIIRREEAQAHAGQIVAGSGERGKPRRMPRMVSARLDGELLRRLRIVAQQRNMTVSDLLREGAELIVEDAYADAQPRTSFTVSGTQGAFHEPMSGRAFATHR
jgi:polyribonucleotide nucleotidyltransferase